MCRNFHIFGTCFRGFEPLQKFLKLEPSNVAKPQLASILPNSFLWPALRNRQPFPKRIFDMDGQTIWNHIVIVVLFGSFRLHVCPRADEAPPSTGVLGLVCSAAAAAPVIEFCSPRLEKKDFETFVWRGVLSMPDIGHCFRFLFCGTGME